MQIFDIKISSTAIQSYLTPPHTLSDTKKRYSPMSSFSESGVYVKNSLITGKLSNKP